jgi:hypothetical protein
MTRTADSLVQSLVKQIGLNGAEAHDIFDRLHGTVPAPASPAACDRPPRRRAAPRRADTRAVSLHCVGPVRPAAPGRDTPA